MTDARRDRNSGQSEQWANTTSASVIRM